MKKLVFMFVAMVAVSFASCGGSENKGAQSDSDSVTAPAVEEVASDSDSTNTAAADSNTVEAPAAETEAAAQ
ncbi:MAG: hypothetical protein EGR33_02455 [Prevotella sp.]|nr:hypothetical protein [Prevotella sp.]